MTGDLVRVLEVATIGIAVATTGAAVLVLKIMTGSSLSREIDDDLRQRHQG